jgi:hypothetical protein
LLHRPETPQNKIDLGLYISGILWYNVERGAEAGAPYITTPLVLLWRAISFLSLGNISAPAKAELVLPALIEPLRRGFFILITLLSQRQKKPEHRL